MSEFEHFYEELGLSEQVNWLLNERDEHEYAVHPNWIRTTPTKSASIAAETKFCSPEIVKEFDQIEANFKRLKDIQRRRLRKNINPLEAISHISHFTRPTIKFFNLDYLLSNAPSMGQSILPPMQPQYTEDTPVFYYAELDCATFSGFSDFLQTRCTSADAAASIVGILLAGREGRIDRNPSMFVHCIPNAMNMKAYEIGEFIAFARQQSYGGVHLVVADGTFVVHDRIMPKELLCKKYHLVQVSLALEILRPHGTFIMKMFDTLTPYTVGLIFLLHQCFRAVSIVKPTAMRPGNGERYLVCRWMKTDLAMIPKHLQRIFRIMDATGFRGDVIEIVPLRCMESDKIFMKFMRDSNESIMPREIIAMRQMLDAEGSVSSRSSLNAPPAEEMKEHFRKLWDIPLRKREDLPFLRSNMSAAKKGSPKTYVAPVDVDRRPPSPTPSVLQSYLDIWNSGGSENNYDG